MLGYLSTDIICSEKRTVFCLMKLNGLKEKHYVNEIAPQDTKMCLEVMF